MAPNYSIGSINDPYLLAALQSPNYYQSAAAQTQQAQAVSQTTTPLITVPQQQIPEEQESSNKGVIAGGILAVGAAVLCLAAHGKGAKNLKGFARIFDGLKQYKKGFGGWFKNTITGKTVNQQEVFQVANKNGKYVCRIPERTNIMRQNTTEKLKELGASTNIKHLADEKGKLIEGSSLRSYEFKYDGMTIGVRKGKIKSIMRGDKDLLARFKDPVGNDIKTLERINNRITKYDAGNNLGELSNIVYTNTENGLTKMYSTASIKATPKLEAAITKDFSLESNVADMYLTNNPKAREFVRAVKKGDVAIENLTYAKLDVKNIGTFVVKENGEIVEIITKDKGIIKAGSEEFNTLLSKNQATFENVPKRHTDFYDKTYALAA